MCKKPSLLILPLFVAFCAIAVILCALWEFPEPSTVNLALLLGNLHTQVVALRVAALAMLKCSRALASSSMSFAEGLGRLPVST